ncbi:transposase [Crenothrix polyspora]|uniref:Transposase n=1 Tax=Crenothrix polyspora TaxID=360316 RepID=A0A1R4H0J9_9GAMM|nr:IS5 family transposase [Crenothrix polyspora]SJM89735.1 transposase [Crenothrix polyspora]
MAYKTDLTDAMWDLIKHFFAPVNKRGNSHKHPKRAIVNAILYLLEGGIKWRMLPNDFPPWKTVYDHFSKWNKAGVWERVLSFVNKYYRKKVGRLAGPSYGIIDSQSVKTQYASEERGIVGNKKIKGHKRHIVVDILGNLLHVVVHAANLSDTKSGCDVLEGAVDKCHSLEAFSGDAGYRGTAVKFTSETLGMTLHISEKIEGKWAVLPKRWVVERTFAWLGKFRRLSKDFEMLAATSENMIRIAMLKITLAKCV